MFWNGSRNAALLGSIAAPAWFGKNGVIQICGRLAPTSRTPKLRVLDTVIQYIGSAAAPSVCWNGAHRPHEFVRPRPAFDFDSSIGVPLPSDLTTHRVALPLLYEVPDDDRLNSTH